MNGYLLDTNIVSLLFRGTVAPIVLRHLQEAPLELCFVSSVTIAEMLKGALALIRKDENSVTSTQGHRLITTLVRHFRDYQILEYDTDAKAIYQRFPASAKRNGRADCEIAASAIQNDLVVVTRNLRHFQAIPGVICEDWTQV